MLGDRGVLATMITTTQTAVDYQVTSNLTPNNNYQNGRTKGKHTKEQLHDGISPLEWDESMDNREE
jgi:hypothetical protein